MTDDVGQRLRRASDATGGEPPPLSTISNARRRFERRRRRLVATVWSAAAITAIVAGASVVRSEAGPAAVDPASPILTNEFGEEMLVEHVAQIDDWLQGYDQDELAHIDPDMGQDDSLTERAGLVVTMELRIACRALDAVAASARSADLDVDVAHTLMDPVVARLRERQLYRESQLADMFERLTDRLAMGDHEFVQRTLDRNCSDALDSRWTPES